MKKLPELQQILFKKKWDNDLNRLDFTLLDDASNSLLLRFNSDKSTCKQKFHSSMCVAFANDNFEDKKASSW